MRPQVSNTPIGETMSVVPALSALATISGSGEAPFTKQTAGTSMSSATRIICRLMRLVTSRVRSEASFNRSLTRSPA